jgi:hypothetical protein
MENGLYFYWGFCDAYSDGVEWDKCWRTDAWLRVLYKRTKEINHLSRVITMDIFRRQILCGLALFGNPKVQTRSPRAHKDNRDFRSRRIRQGSAGKSGWSITC